MEYDPKTMDNNTLFAFDRSNQIEVYLTTVDFSNLNSKKCCKSAVIFKNKPGHIIKGADGSCARFDEYRYPTAKEKYMYSTLYPDYNYSVESLFDSNVL